MSTRQERQKMAEETVYKIGSLLNNLIHKLDLSLTVKVATKVESSRPDYMEDIEALVTTLLPKNFQRFGLRGKTRLAEYLKYKHITFYILRKKGFGSSEIANHFGIKHSDVIYAYNKIRDYLASNDEQTLTAYTLLLTAIDKRINIHDSFIQTGPRKRVDA